MVLSVNDKYFLVRVRKVLTGRVVPLDLLEKRYLGDITREPVTVTTVISDY